MSNELYSFSDILQSVYSDVHSWLENNIDEAKGYKNLNPSERPNYLDGGSFKYVAAQFHRHFHSHYFKARYLLKNLVTTELMGEWIKNNPFFIFIDAGCGAGAASVAYLELLNSICEQKDIMADVLCIGFDPDEYAIVMYNQLMTRFTEKLSSSRLKIEYSPLLLGLPHLKELSDLIEEKRTIWDIPRIPQTTLFRMNVDRPLSIKHNEDTKRQEFLESYGISSSEKRRNYGIEEAEAYEEFLLEKSRIDNLNIVGVATKTVSDRLNDFQKNIEKIVVEREHRHSGIAYSKYATSCSNPIDSLSENKPNYSITYYATVDYIVNKNLIKDIRWDKILSLDSLRLAWARARRNLMQKEAMYDEVEIRLFESNLDGNLSLLASRLNHYVSDALQVEDILAFKTPKSGDRQRPRGLTRLEEEIIFTSLIQDLGVEFSGRYHNSFAYSVNTNKKLRNEYLYKNWFNDYQLYIESARESASKYKMSGTVIQTDITKFYEKIIQQKLLEISEAELYRYSDRLEWLLHRVLLREHREHDDGKGLTQGSIGSGFFANVYLSPLHTFMKKYDVEFFRYVDDMIIVVKNKADVEIILQDLKDFLQKELDLNLNEDKTQVFENVNDFLEATGEDTFLSSFYEEHQNLVNPLWIGQSSFQEFFRNVYDDEIAWWRSIEIYQKCLKEISIYIDIPTLSRRISTYLPDTEYVNERRTNSESITIPYLPDDFDSNLIQKWAKTFQTINQDYFARLEKHRRLLNIRFHEFCEVIEYDEVDKKMESKIRFVVNRLAEVGLSEIADKLVKIIIYLPWLLDINLVFEYLGLNGLYSHLNEVMNYYNTKTKKEEREYVMAMALRAIRYVPNLSRTDIFRLFEYATRSPSIIEKIMASETLLIRQDDVPPEMFSAYLTKFDECLANEKNSRLAKNYILLLGQDISNDYIADPKNEMLKSAQFLALNGNVNSIFEDIEPAILRKEFYGSMEFYRGDGY